MLSAGLQEELELLSRGSISQATDVGFYLYIWLTRSRSLDSKPSNIKCLMKINVLYWSISDECWLYFASIHMGNSVWLR